MNSTVLGVLSTLNQNGIIATPERIAAELGLPVKQIMQSLYDLEDQDLVSKTMLGGYSLTEEGLNALYHG
jgi:Mn-dependent DtxR family transcriptional regulator